MTNSLIAALKSTVADPRRGLPEEVFLLVSRLVPMINVDLLIQDDRGRTLLAWRDDEFFGAGWHIPGGIIRYKETAADRVRACAELELDVEVAFDSAPMLVSETIRAEATRGHFISLLYRCSLLSQPDEARRAKNPPSAGEWSWHQCCPADLLPVQSQYARFFRSAR